MAMNAMGMTVTEWDGKTDGEQWLFVVDLMAAKKTLGSALETKTKRLESHKRVIENNIVSMQRRDNRIRAQGEEIVELKAQLAKEIQSNKTREGIIWATAREEKCKKRGFALAEEGKAAVDDVEGDMTIFQRRGIYRERKEHDDKRGQLMSPQDRIWVRHYFIQKVLEMEAGKLTAHDMAVVWPSYPVPPKYKRHRQPLTKKRGLAPAKEDEEKDTVLEAMQAKAYEKDQEWSEGEEE